MLRVALEGDIPAAGLLDVGEDSVSAVDAATALEPVPPALTQSHQIRCA